MSFYLIFSCKSLIFSQLPCYLHFRLHLIFSKVFHVIWAFFFPFFKFQFKVLFIRLARFLLGAFLSDILSLLHGVCSITSRSTRLENLVLVFFCYFEKVLLDTHYLLFLLQSHGLDWKKGRKHPFNTDTKNLLSFIAKWINRV